MSECLVLTSSDHCQLNYSTAAECAQRVRDERVVERWTGEQGFRAAHSARLPGGEDEAEEAGHAQIVPRTALYLRQGRLFRFLTSGLEVPTLGAVSSSACAQTTVRALREGGT